MEKQKEVTQEKSKKKGKWLKSVAMVAAVTVAAVPCVMFGACSNNTDADNNDKTDNETEIVDGDKNQGGNVDSGESTDNNNESDHIPVAGDTYVFDSYGMVMADGTVYDITESVKDTYENVKIVFSEDGVSIYDTDGVPGDPGAYTIEDGKVITNTISYAEFQIKGKTLVCEKQLSSSGLSYTCILIFKLQ